MSGKVISAAVFALMALAAPVKADLRGPAELPPQSFKGQQYVDSRGCVFLRAGYGGQVTWVPRVSRDRKQLCGYAPSGRAVETAEAPAALPPSQPMAKTPQPQTPAAPSLAKPNPVRPAVEAAKPAPAKPAVATLPAQPGYKLACPAELPHAQSFPTNRGGQIVLCTTGTGDLKNARFPELVAGTLAGQKIGFDAYQEPQAKPAQPATGGTVFAGETLRERQTSVAPAPKAKPAPIPAPPPGYKLAWEDDRLNPHRGLGTSAGDAAQARVWSKTVPAKLMPHAGSEAVHFEPLRKSSKSDPAPAPKTKPQMAARLLVQVGTFGEPQNANGTAARLTAEGLPVRRAQLSNGLQVIYAGPFASKAEAAAALNAARAMGYKDALIARTKG